MTVPVSTTPEPEVTPTEPQTALETEPTSQEPSKPLTADEYRKIRARKHSARLKVSLTRQK